MMAYWISAVSFSTAFLGSVSLVTSKLLVADGNSPPLTSSVMGIQ